jgi:hypothetical protein
VIRIYDNTCCIVDQVGKDVKVNKQNLRKMYLLQRRNPPAGYEAG